MNSHPPFLCTNTIGAGRLVSYIRLAIGLLATALLFACGKSDNSTKAQLRMLNLAPESGTFAMRIKDESTDWLSNIAYKNTTSFKDLDSGSIRTRISNAGGVVLDNTISYLAGRKQLLAIYGGKSSLSLMVLQNDITSSASGKTKLRLINMAVGLGIYDLYLTTSSEDYRSVEPKLRNVSGTTYEFDAGSYAMRLTSPGTKDILFEIPSRSYDSQKYYNVGLYNEGSGELPQGFWLQQDSDSAPEFITSTVTRLRAGNGQQQYPNLNVQIGSTRAFTNIPFGGISSFTRTASGTRTVSYQEPVNGAVVSSVNDTFDGGRDYSVFLSPGLNGSPPSAFRVLDRIFPPSSGKTRVRLVNASTLTDLALALSFSPITPSIGTRASSDYFEVNAGDGTPVTITQGSSGTPVVNLSGTDLLSGRNYTFLVSGIAGALAITVRQDN